MGNISKAPWLIIAIMDNKFIKHLINKKQSPFTNDKTSLPPWEGG
jgi:hypothetical protein